MNRPARTLGVLALFVAPSFACGDGDDAAPSPVEATAGASSPPLEREVSHATLAQRVWLIRFLTELVLEIDEPSAEGGRLAPRAAGANGDGGPAEAREDVSKGDAAVFVREPGLGAGKGVARVARELRSRRLYAALAPEGKVLERQPPPQLAVGITRVILSPVKTAISLPDDVFRAVEAAAKRLKVSRSELFARAAVRFLATPRRRASEALVR